MPPSFELLPLLAPAHREGVLLRRRLPRPWPSLMAAEEVARRRSLSCPEYDACLDDVLEAGWRGWTCHHCPYFPLAAAFRAREARHHGEERTLADEA